MKLGVIADDFTGASDIALTLAEGGMTCAQFVGVPDGPVATGRGSRRRRAEIAHRRGCRGGCAVLGRLRLAAGARRAADHVQGLFDLRQHADKGNIGPVAASPRRATGRDPCRSSARPFLKTGAASIRGISSSVTVLLNESGMQDHPLTPMTRLRPAPGAGGADQTGRSHICRLQIVSQGADAIDELCLPAALQWLSLTPSATPTCTSSEPRGSARKLLTGGSGIALGLPAKFGATPSPPRAGAAVTGPGVGPVGLVQRRQRAVRSPAMPRDHPAPRDHRRGACPGQPDLVRTLQAWVVAQNDPPLIYSSADPDAGSGRAAGTRRGRVAQAIERLFQSGRRASPRRA